MEPSFNKQILLTKSHIMCRHLSGKQEIKQSRSPLNMQVSIEKQIYKDPKLLPDLLYIIHDEWIHVISSKHFTSWPNRKLNQRRTRFRTPVKIENQKKLDNT